MCSEHILAELTNMLYTIYVFSWGTYTQTQTHKHINNVHGGK